MLGKLIKYEFKSTAKWFLPLYAFTLLMSPLAKMMLSSSLSAEGILEVISKCIIILYGFSIIATFFITFFLIVCRFYKSMTTGEGYLTHTLPISTTKILIGKLISSVLWILLASIVTMLSMIILVADIESFSEFFELFSISGMKEIVTGMFGSEVSIVLIIIELLVLMLSGICYYILEIYAAIAIGQLFNNQKLLASFASYFVLRFIVQIFSVFLMLVPIFSSLLLDTTKYFSFKMILPFGILSTFLFSAIYFIIINYIFSKKLNLE